MGELLPCPFCGSEAEIIVSEDDDGRFAAVSCPKCGAGSRQHYFCGEDAREFAADAWNTRPRTEGRGEGEPGSFSPNTENDPPLHPATADLVSRFMGALAEKLAAAEAKYGYSDGWASPIWQEECRRQLHHHAAKGDPRDVAAYAAFCWHHGWSTASPIREPEISRTELIKLLADRFGFRPYEQMAEDKSDLRGKIRDGYDVNEPTKSDLAEVADAILNLAPVGGRGEEGSSRADLSPASRSPDQNSAGGEG